ncbi:hypothetical protein LPTSP4_25840 [Leptospira ryugenii]|uniref:Uncharacterized protein n=1 Tax=Leptospira ryugenii TaxID=1917863 RepID=A0A2P2E2C0_9LEPT|nr:hypothetical protein [Leptospira ryugenii]GBF51053.1 hypothetical protein LPTSP4_25840 [Leptospira ryugenii]
MRIVRFVIFVSLFLQFACTSKKKNDVDENLLNFLLTQRSGVDGACQKFLVSESNCVSAPDNSVAVCPSLISTLKSKIDPSSKATDSVAELYFNCFAEINVVYNQAINCSKSSFASTNDYRRAQRGLSSGSSQNAVSAWKLQYNNCASVENGIPPANSGLREAGTKLSADPFL